MSTLPIYSWILDSGGAGRGAWQGGVIYELMRWTRQNGCYPLISMGASAGGYAAADVATETEKTVIKGWTKWGKEALPPLRQVPKEFKSFWGFGQFRIRLTRSIEYVMGPQEVSAVFNNRPDKKLLIFTTRVRRKDGGPITWQDNLRFFIQSVCRKIPKPLKYLPSLYHQDPVVFAYPLPDPLHSECVRPLTPFNYHRVIEASCLVPFAMGHPLPPRHIIADRNHDHPAFADDAKAVFMDGSFGLKMPMALFQEDVRFRALARWVRTKKTIIFSCDPRGKLWETSSRLRSLNHYGPVYEDIKEDRLMVIHPDHKVKAGFLCHDNPVILRTFQRGQEQAGRLMKSDKFRRFFGV
jgi:hypothetical protein